jgi:two-component system LytT family response regulator
VSVRALIVDDEALVRQRIRTLLQEHSQIVVIGECVDGVAAIQTIRRERPDLVFLDVQMPRLDGFGVLAHLPEPARPVIVFITAYDQYAIRAFDVGAADYVLKPVQPDRFATAVTRALERLTASVTGRPALSALLRDVRAQGHPLDRFVVERRGRVRVIPAAQVRWLESVRNYVRVHVDDGSSHVIRTTLGALADQLDPERFLRIHRATIVQVARVRALSPRGHGDATVTLDDGTQLPASRSRVAALRALVPRAR